MRSHFKLEVEAKPFSNLAVGTRRRGHGNGNINALGDLGGAVVEGGDTRRADDLTFTLLLSANVICNSELPPRRAEDGKPRDYRPTPRLQARSPQSRFEWCSETTTR